MKQRKIPLRMCLGCMQMKTKKELLRIVKNKENQICVDFTGKKAGRGAYMCKDIGCFEKAKKTKKLERTFEAPIEESVYLALKQQMEENNGE